MSSLRVVCHNYGQNLYVDLSGPSVGRTQESDQTFSGLLDGDYLVVAVCDGKADVSARLSLPGDTQVDLTFS